jgi:hypothetical protein
MGNPLLRWLTPNEPPRGLSCAIMSMRRAAHSDASGRYETFARHRFAEDGHVLRRTIYLSLDPTRQT